MCEEGARKGEPEGFGGTDYSGLCWAAEGTGMWTAQRTTESRVIITSLVLIQLKRELELIICCCIKQIKCNDWPLGEKRFGVHKQSRLKPSSLS